MSLKATLELTLHKLTHSPSFKTKTTEDGLALDDEIAVLESAGIQQPNDILMEFYREKNGLNVIWRTSGEIDGGVNILPLMQSAMRGPLGEEGEPLEGVLWNSEMDDALAGRLQKMTIFESVPGKNQFITYEKSGKSIELFFVEDEEIKKIQIEFFLMVELLVQYMGVGEMRRHFVHKDCQDRVLRDPDCVAFLEIV